MKYDTMDRVASGWMLNTVRKNYWRVEATHDFDDLVHEGLATWLKIKNKYPKAKTKHQMRLFQISFVNRIHDLSKIDQYIPRAGVKQKPFKPRFEPLDPATHGGAAECSYAQLLMFIAEAPEPIKSVLKALVLAANGRLLRSPYRFRPGHRETSNERVARLSGVEQTPDLLGQVRAYIRAR